MCEKILLTNLKLLYTLYGLFFPRSPISLQLSILSIFAPFWFKMAHCMYYMYFVGKLNKFVKVSYITFILTFARSLTTFDVFILTICHPSKYYTAEFIKYTQTMRQVCRRWISRKNKFGGTIKKAKSIPYC